MASGYNRLMTEWREWDWPPEPKKRSRRPRIQTVEILPPRQPEPERRIHVNVNVHHRRNVSISGIPPWLIVLVIVAALCWVSPFGLVVALVMGGILLTAHPTVAIIIGVSVALVIIIGLKEQLSGRPF
jgi:hypothetical protein